MAASLPTEPADLLITHPPMSCVIALPTRRIISAKNWPSRTSRDRWPSSPTRFLPHLVHLAMELCWGTFRRHQPL